MNASSAIPLILLSILVSGAHASVAEMASHLFAHKDGDAVLRYNDNLDWKLEVGNSGARSAAWITFQAGGADLSLASGASLTLDVEFVQVPGTLKVFLLTAPVEGHEDQVGARDFHYNPDAPIASVPLTEADEFKIVRINLAHTIGQGAFHGVVLASTDGLKAYFGSKDSDIPPAIELRYPFVSAEQIDKAMAAFALVESSLAAVGQSQASAAASAEAAYVKAVAAASSALAASASATEATNHAESASAGAAASQTASSASAAGASASLASATASGESSTASRSSAAASEMASAASAAGAAASQTSATGSEASSISSRMSATSSETAATASVAAASAADVSALAAAASQAAGAVSAASATASAMAAAASAAAMVNGDNFPEGTALLTTRKVPPPGFSATGIRINYDMPWMARPAGAISRSEVAYAVTAGRLYSAGGTSGSSAMSLVQAYDPVTYAWTRVASLPAISRQASMVEAGGKLYLSGGIGGGNTVQGTLRSYDPAENAWTTLSSMPARWGHASAAAGGKIYVFGGYSSLGMAHQTLTYAYDIASDTWSEVAPMPTWRAQMQAIASGDGIYVMGGVSQESLTPVNEVYHPTTDAWTQAAPLPTGRSRYGAVADNGRIYVFGGESGGITNTCLQFDVTADSWMPIQPLIQARGQFAVGSIEGRVIASQGSGGSGILSTTEEYALPKTVYLVEKRGN